MAIVDQAHEIRQGLHRIKANELESASGAELDRAGREYSLGREQSETDEHFRHRIWMQIMKVMTDAAAAETERRREEDRVVVWVPPAHSTAYRKRWAVRGETTAR